MIALDANGADNGAAAVAQGGRESGVPVTIFGPAAEIPAGTDVVDAPVAITNDDEPARAVRARPESSLVQAAKAVKEGRADAIVSAGPTGALMAAAALYLKRMKGVHRPAAAVLLPVPGNPTLLLDSGANLDVRAEYLVQFAYMGSMFMESVHGVARPTVGLLSNGHEPTKGVPQVVEANELLAAGPLNFVGNVEGGDIVTGELDVVVTDGFTGNVALKAVEGTAKMVSSIVRRAARSSPPAALGGLLMSRKLGELRHELSQDNVGGGIMLGLRGVAVAAHGSASATGIANAVRLAQRAVDERMVERTEAALKAAGALRSSEPAISLASSDD
ncbi:MAG: phosphate acyltransferase [Thermoleophilaceae bacterium]|nr:phosphate acyltransferase [Thermoleophilaceae bacterium]